MHLEFIFFRVKEWASNYSHFANNFHIFRKILFLWHSIFIKYYISTAAQSQTVLFKQSMI